MIDSERGATREEDAQGTPTQSHISLSILVYEDEGGLRNGCPARIRFTYGLINLLLITMNHQGSSFIQIEYYVTRGQKDTKTKVDSTMRAAEAACGDRSPTTFFVNFLSKVNSLSKLKFLSKANVRVDNFLCPLMRGVRVVRSWSNIEHEHDRLSTIGPKA